MTQYKHIHIIGICGVLTHGLAIALHAAGVRVTGSDAGFYPPVSTYLTQAGVTYYAGWHPEKMTANGKPDLVIMGGGGTTNNKEKQYVLEHAIPYMSAAEFFGKYFAQNNSIVVAGTYGKTTTTSLLVTIMQHAGMHPSYMFGGLSRNAIPACSLGDLHGDDVFDPSKHTGMSILEGDEYKAAAWDERSKFWHYHPKHLVLTAVVWDHADLFKTEAQYINNFKTLLMSLPPDGSVVVGEQVRSVLELPQHAITYGRSQDNDYQYSDVTVTKQGVTLTMTHHSAHTTLTVPVLGYYWAENIAASFARAHALGIPADTIAAALTTYTGIKRRLERKLDADIVVIDDIAHSPTKAKASLATLKAIYKTNIRAIFEPNQGARRPSMLDQYDAAFEDATTILIPRLTKLKTDPNNTDQPIAGAELAQTISKTHPNVQYIEDDDALVRQITEQAQPGDVIVFLGSHGFRGMIEDTVAILQ